MSGRPLVLVQVLGACGRAHLRASAGRHAALPLFPTPSLFSPILFSFYYCDFLTSEEASYETGVIQTRLV